MKKIQNVGRSKDSAVFVGIEVWIKRCEHATWSKTSTQIYRHRYEHDTWQRNDDNAKCNQRKITAHSSVGLKHLDIRQLGISKSKSERN